MVEMNDVIEVFALVVIAFALSVNATPLPSPPDSSIPESTGDQTMSMIHWFAVISMSLVFLMQCVLMILSGRKRRSGRV